MIFSGRRLLLSLSIILVVAGIVFVLDAWGGGTLDQSMARIFAGIVIGCGVVSILVLNVYSPPLPMAKSEPDDIDALTESRRRELIRGTSLHLREMRYRYSVRFEPSDASQRRNFNAEVNTVKLGFIPAVVSDNTTERQGWGYVAFVYDGRRWRGPGLPCPDGQAEAVRHAAKCVSPLATEEETQF
ncbi:MAG: hypothetical protein O7G85_15580 [Planctomycetota bacterium]|nr:hypothetical protein [Planctomycetota bacterium]